MKTKVNRTSIANHQKNLQGRVYQPLQAVIISALKRKRRPMTRSELAIATGLAINSVCGRVHDLIDGKALKAVGTQKCSITGRNVEGVFLA